MSPWDELLAFCVPTSPGIPSAEVAARHARFTLLLGELVAQGVVLPPIIKISGTCGKGSVCFLLEALLRSAGLRTCVVTSPHLTHPGERVRIDGLPLAQEMLDAGAARLLPILCGLLRTAGEASRPSFFEAVLLLAFERGFAAGVDVAIVEVAIGGYADVASVLESPLAAITSVGMDHVAELGPTVVDIARNKAGIASPCSVLVLGPKIIGEPRAAIAADADPRGVDLRQPALNAVTGAADSTGGFTVQYEGQSFTLPLRGRFQLDNLATALTVFEECRRLGWSGPADVANAIGGVRAPGRLELLEGHPSWLLDVAHNELAFSELSEYLFSRYDRHELVLLFGASSSARLHEGLLLLLPRVFGAVVTGGFYRACTSTDLQSLGDYPPPLVEWTDTPEEAVSRASAYGTRTVLVTGSLYLVGAVSLLLKQRQ